MIIEFASEVSNLAWRVSQSQNGGAIFTLTKWSPMFGSVVFDHQWCILIVMSVKSSFYNEYDIKNNEKHVLWAQRSFQNHHQTFHDRCPEKIGPLPKKSDHWFTRTCPENIRPAPTWLIPAAGYYGFGREPPRRTDVFQKAPEKTLKKPRKIDLRTQNPEKETENRLQRQYRRKVLINMETTGAEKGLWQQEQVKREIMLSVFLIIAHHKLNTAHPKTKQYESRQPR